MKTDERRERLGPERHRSRAIAPRISEPGALPENVAMPTSPAATADPRSTLCRRTRAVGAATSIRVDDDRSFTHARSRPDHVVVIRRRLDTTRAPATTGSPSRLTTSALASSQGRTRASPAITCASTPTSSPASTTICSPGRTSAAGSSTVSSPWITRTRTSSAWRMRSRPASRRTRARATRRSTASADDDARPAKTATPTACGACSACAQNDAATPAAVGTRTTSRWGSAASRRATATRNASAAHATTTKSNRTCSAIEPSRPMAGASTPAAIPALSSAARRRSRPRSARGRALTGGSGTIDAAAAETSGGCEGAPAAGSGVSTRGAVADVVGEDRRRRRRRRVRIVTLPTERR